MCKRYNVDCMKGRSTMTNMMNLNNKNNAIALYHFDNIAAIRASISEEELSANTAKIEFTVARMRDLYSQEEVEGLLTATLAYLEKIVAKHGDLDPSAEEAVNVVKDIATSYVSAIRANDFRKMAEISIISEVLMLQLMKEVKITDLF